jgi:hypothetical protein
MRGSCRRWGSSVSMFIAPSPSSRFSSTAGSGTVAASPGVRQGRRPFEDAPAGRRAGPRGDRQQRDPGSTALALHPPVRGREPGPGPRDRLDQGQDRQVDAGMLAKLDAGGFLPEVWVVDEETQARRRLVAERAQLHGLVSGSAGLLALLVESHHVAGSGRSFTRSRPTAADAAADGPK